METKYHPIPQPDEISDRQKEDAMGAYFMMFASAAIGMPLPILNIIAAIIYYYVNRNKGRFVRFNTLQSLFSQIPVTLLNLGAVFWLLRTLILELSFTNQLKAYLGVVIIANLIYFIFSIVGAVRSHKGRFYYFWFFGKWAFHQVYKVRENEDEEKQAVNKPPKM